jgi:hypothetical protein
MFDYWRAIHKLNIWEFGDDFPIWLSVAVGSPGFTLPAQLSAVTFSCLKCACREWHLMDSLHWTYSPVI